jgi:hypothetical protein
MDTVQQAAQVLAEHRYVGTSPRPGWMCANHNPPFFAEQFIDVSIHLAQALADAGLLADTRCRKCNGTGGTDLSGARCAVCNGAGHRRGER